MCGIGLMCVEGWVRVFVEVAECVGLVDRCVGCNNGYGVWIGVNDRAVEGGKWVCVV